MACLRYVLLVIPLCLAVCRVVFVVQGEEFIHRADVSMGLWESAGAKRICVWATGASIRPAAHGGWGHMPHLPGDPAHISALLSSQRFLTPFLIPWESFSHSLIAFQTQAVSQHESEALVRCSANCYYFYFWQDTMDMPIKLTCSHLFCDNCISTWLARERTCPMCRTIVRPAGTMGCTDGSTSLAPLVF